MTTNIELEIQIAALREEFAAFRKAVDTTFRAINHAEWMKATRPAQKTAEEIVAVMYEKTAEAPVSAVPTVEEWATIRKGLFGTEVPLTTEQIIAVAKENQ